MSSRRNGRWVRGLPTSYFVDQEGVIVLEQVGRVDQAMIEGVLEQVGASKQ